MPWWGWLLTGAGVAVVIVVVIYVATFINLMGGFIK